MFCNFDKSTVVFDTENTHVFYVPPFYGGRTHSRISEQVPIVTVTSIGRNTNRHRCVLPKH